ncbi:SpoIIE family protein phosphatase [Streptomyces sp. NPDC008139]|uniref:PP2C family protein-serine/threonine phosphatase n=1 Tax=Streptomyces sp. NPDC008139 TaxID=3364814 RepID=UPI0036E28BBB
MSAAHMKKVAGTEPPPSAAAQNASPAGGPAQVTAASAVPAVSPAAPPAPATEPAGPRTEPVTGPATAPAADSTIRSATGSATDSATVPVSDQATEPAAKPVTVPGAGRPRAPEEAAGDRYGSPAVQDRLASWVCDLSLVHELTERLARTTALDDALHEVLRAGATLVGARRGMVALEPADGLGPERTVGLGLGHADLGTIETVPVPRTSASDTGVPSDACGSGARDGSAAADGSAARDGSGARDGSAAADGSAARDADGERVHADLLHEPGLDRRHREVAVQLGLGASYALRLTAQSAGRLGTAVWFYDEPAEPDDRQRRLMGLYLRFAAEHTARVLDLRRARDTTAALAAELLPERLPRVPGVRLAVRHRTNPRGGGDWYDALPLPEGALGLAVGGVTGRGPGAVAAMGRLRASLRAYAVMEGEDPVAVLSDLELLMRLTEPARSATALFAYVEAEAGNGGPGGRKLILAGAGHCPPLVIGDRRCEYVETSLSAPLNMLSCWEAPSVELYARPGETLVLFTDGLLHRTGESADRALARLHAAAQSAPRPARDDPDRLVDHILHAVLPDGLDRSEGVEDVVLLAVRFD